MAATREETAVVCHWVESVATRHKIQSSRTRQKLSPLGGKYNGLLLGRNFIYCAGQARGTGKSLTVYIPANRRKIILKVYIPARSAEKNKKKTYSTNLF